MIYYKSELKLIFIGSTDSGKSTTAGQLINRYAPHLRLKLDFKENEIFTWFLDELKAKRERGQRIDPQQTQFFAENRKFSITEVSGHRLFLRNLIEGSSQAGCAVLVISSNHDQFIQGLQSQQTMQQARLIFDLGIRQLVICINKLDLEEDNTLQMIYNQIRLEVSHRLRGIGFSVDTLCFIPISASFADNLFQPSIRTPWYKGLSLIQALLNAEPFLNRVYLPLRIPIQDVYKIGGIGHVPVGRVETGLIKQGMNLTIAPQGLAGEVRQLQLFHANGNEAQAGDTIGFPIKGLKIKDLRRGQVASDSMLNPARRVYRLIAQIVIIYHPTCIRKGQQTWLYIHTAKVKCQLNRLISKIDQRTNVLQQAQPKQLKKGDVAFVQVRPLKMLTCDVFREISSLGRFILVDFKRIVAVGIVAKVDTVAQLQLRGI